MKMGGSLPPQANEYVQNKMILLLFSNNIIIMSIYSLVKLGIVLSVVRFDKNNQVKIYLQYSRY